MFAAPIVIVSSSSIESLWVLHQTSNVIDLTSHVIVIIIVVDGDVVCSYSQCCFDGNICFF